MESGSEIATYKESYGHALDSLELDPVISEELARRSARQDPASAIVHSLLLTSNRLASVVESLGATSEALQSIADAALNPTATRSEELRRRAAFAIENGWTEEASSDLEVALEANPYDPISWYLLGRAKVMLGDLPGAGEAYFRAAKYGAPKSKPFSAFALIAASSALDEGGEEDRAIKVLQLGKAWCSPCPEVGLALARRTGDVADLAEVFTMDPSMIVDAITVGAVQVDEAAQVCLEEFAQARISLLQQVIAEALFAHRVIHGQVDNIFPDGPWTIRPNDRLP